MVLLSIFFIFSPPTTLFLSANKVTNAEHRIRTLSFFPSTRMDRVSRSDALRRCDLGVQSFTFWWINFSRKNPTQLDCGITCLSTLIFQTKFKDIRASFGPVNFIKSWLVSFSTLWGRWKIKVASVSRSFYLAELSYCFVYSTPFWMWTNPSNSANKIRNLWLFKPSSTVR